MVIQVVLPDLEKKNIGYALLGTYLTKELLVVYLKFPFKTLGILCFS